MMGRGKIGAMNAYSDSSAEKERLKIHVLSLKREMGSVGLTAVDGDYFPNSSASFSAS